MNETIMGVPTLVFWQLVPFVAVGVYFVFLVLLRLLETRTDVSMTGQDEFLGSAAEEEHRYDDQSWLSSHGNRAPHSTWDYNSGNYPGV